MSTSAELDRILRLPRRPPVLEGSATAAALIEVGMRRYSRGPRACQCAEIDPARAEKARSEGRSPCIERLLWVQALLLHEISVADGLFAAAPVGGGKTLVWLLTPLALRDCPLCLLLIPPTLVDQIIIDYQLVAEHFRVPGLVVHTPGRTTWQRAPRAAPGGGVEPMLHVIPYSKMSGIDNSDWIERLQPDAIIADECDALADTESARTMRLLRYYDTHDNTKFVGGTGSATDQGISEMAHLMALALGEGSPLPTDNEAVLEWSRALDSVPNPCPPGALIRFLEPGQPTSQLRQALHRRMVETTGVIMIRGRQSVVTSSGREVQLVVRQYPPPTIPPIVLEALEKVRNSCRPDTLVGNDEDEILVDPLEQARCAHQVAAGFFYRWIFPRGEKRDLIKRWYAARKAWNSELRIKMLRGEVQLDSPKLCENAARRAWGDAPSDPELPEWRAENWPAWRDVMDLVQPETEVKRLHPFFAENVAEWGLRHRGKPGDGAIIWYTMVELAAWVAELSGLPLFGGGPDAGKRLMDEITLHKGDRSIIASIKSHGRGRDRLQYAFNKQRLINVPASDRVWQQLLGRTRRRGQEQDILTEVDTHTPELQGSVDQALRRGEYVEAITGEERNLLNSWQGRMPGS